jgi:hypothetical protein
MEVHQQHIYIGNERVFRVLTIETQLDRASASETKSRTDKQVDFSDLASVSITGESIVLKCHLRQRCVRTSLIEGLDFVERSDDLSLKLCDVETATSAKKAIDALITNAKAPAAPSSSPAWQSELSRVEQGSSNSVRQPKPKQQNESVPDFEE